MDKHFMKVALQAEGLPVAPWVTVRGARWAAKPCWQSGLLSRALHLPLWPSLQGRSVRNLMRGLRSFAMRPAQ